MQRYIPPKSFRLSPAERAMLRELAGERRGAASQLVRRLIREEARRQNVVLDREPAPQQAA